MRKTNKQPINNIPKFNIGQVLYAISFNNDSVDTLKQAAEKDEWDRDFARIHKIQIESIIITNNGIQYWLKDTKDNADYGDSVDEKYISKDLSELILILVNRWKL